MGKKATSNESARSYGAKEARAAQREAAKVWEKSKEAVRAWDFKEAAIHAANRDIHPGSAGPKEEPRAAKEVDTARQAVKAA